MGGDVGAPIYSWEGCAFPFPHPQAQPYCRQYKAQIILARSYFFTLTVEVSDVFDKVLPGEKISCHSLECLFHPSA